MFVCTEYPYSQMDGGLGAGHVADLDMAHMPAYGHPAYGNPYAHYGMPPQGPPMMNQGMPMGMPSFGLAPAQRPVITKEVLAANFNLPLNEVAKKLGVCATALKKLCRKYGIARWPHRKLRSIDRKLAALKAEQSMRWGEDEIFHRAEIQRLEQARSRLLETGKEDFMGDGEYDVEEDIDSDGGAGTGASSAIEKSSVGVSVGQSGSGFTPVKSSSVADSSLMGKSTVGSNVTDARASLASDGVSSHVEMAAAIGAVSGDSPSRSMMSAATHDEQWSRQDAADAQARAHLSRLLGVMDEPLLRRCVFALAEGCESPPHAVKMVSSILKSSRNGVGGGTASIPQATMHQQQQAMLTAYYMQQQAYQQAAMHPQGAGGVPPGYAPSWMEQGAQGMQGPGYMQ